MVERDLMVPTKGEKRSSRHMRGGNNQVHDFWQTHRLRGEIPVVELKKKKRKMTGKFLNSSVIILAGIFSEIVVEKITHTKNVNQT